jgi:DNA segregation ATPase FtsK/SpoIIIE, S-DNA-T family
VSTTASSTEPAVPVGPALSIFDPVFIGMDEFGDLVFIPLIERNMLIGGEPGAGKSSLLNTIVGHAALCTDVSLCLLDGKLVEMGLWRPCADVFVGKDMDHALATLQRVQAVLDNRLEYLDSCRRQKIERADEFAPLLVAVDEIAYFSTVAGDKKTQELFANLLRDITARGRAVGVIVVAATQRPSFDIIPTSLRDLFAWRFAGRCTTDASSDVVLGHGWAARGFSANVIDPTNRGEGFLIGEQGIPQRVKGSYMSTKDIIRVSDYGASLPRPGRRLPPELHAVA